MSGQPQFPGFITFDVTGMGVTEPSGAWTPSTVIPRNQPFTLSCTFQIGELFGRGLNDLPPTGPPVFEYNVTYYAESLGPGPDYKFPVGNANVTLAVGCIRGQYSYGSAETSFTVPANTLQANSYELSCRVKMSPAAPPPVSAGFPWHVTGFVQGPTIDVYEP